MKWNPYLALVWLVDGRGAIKNELSVIVWLVDGRGAIKNELSVIEC